jgi:hypothetical protein
LLYLSPIIGPVIIVAAKFKMRGRGAIYCKQNYIMKPTTIRRDYARAKARMVLNECGISRPPTDLEQICSKLGVKIHYHCTDGLKDSFMYLDRSIYNLVIAISGNQARDRWSLAHELGHVVLVNITAAMVKELRERTGAGMMDCKNALVATAGDMEKAIDELRTKGLAKAAKKAGRIASEGVVASYIHGGGRIGVLVEVNCETDFVAKTDQFQQLVHDIAMQIAAAKPEYVSRTDVPDNEIEREKAVLRAQALEEGKPEKIEPSSITRRSWPPPAWMSTACSPALMM